MKIKEVIKNIPIIAKVNKELKKYKYIHLMYNDKFNKPFVDFLNRNFDEKEHLILCKRWINNEDIAPFPVGNNVIEIFSLFGLNLEAENIEKIICHSLFDKEIVNYLYKHDDILKQKAYWLIWGGDLYNAPNTKKDYYVRKYIKAYISDTDGDCEVAKNKYASTPITYDLGYTFPVSYESIQKAVKIKKDFVKIQINNSCDKSTLEMLDVLSKFKDEKMVVSTILSYGDMKYKSEIIEKGIKNFGSKFEYTDELIKPDEYAQFFAQNDILILNQNRQQGVGTSYLALALGCKLFIRSEITTYKYFSSKGIQIFDTNKIKDMSYFEFLEYINETKENNINKSKMFFDENYLKSLWGEIFVNNPNK